MQHKSSAKIAEADFSEMYETLSGVVQPGSPANKEHMQLITVRLTQLGISATETAADRIGSATNELTRVIDDASKQSQVTSDAVINLNGRLLWLTWILVVLTVILTVFGGLQVAKEFGLLGVDQSNQGRDAHES